MMLVGEHLHHIMALIQQVAIVIQKLDHQSQIISTRLDVLMNYADEIYTTHNDFVVEGKSYRDLYLKAQCYKGF